ncbi:MAG: ribosomal-processing cysteine protease Prp [Bacillota bacterium]|nr:ribosomal-processing cysteine protease Prp [Bacillota bacterium]
MINISIVRDKKGFIWEFTVKGHAGYGKYGSDIVCAAVSVVAYTAIGALDELAGIKNYSEKDGYMKCSIPLDIPEDKKQTAGIILETMAIGFKQVRNAYGKYVSVLEEEV